MKLEMFILREISKFMILKLLVTLSDKNTVFTVFLRTENYEHFNYINLEKLLNDIIVSYFENKLNFVTISHVTCNAKLGHAKRSLR